RTPMLDGGLFHYWELFQSYRVFDAKVGDTPLRVDIEMDPGCQVEGVLVDPDSKPVTGALAYGLTHSTQKTANVSYRNDPTYRARVATRPLAPARFVTAGLTPDGARTITFLHPERKLIANIVARANQKGPLTVRLEPWAVVTGCVVDGTGKPVPGVAIELIYP